MRKIFNITCMCQKVENRIRRSNFGRLLYIFVITEIILLQETAAAKPPLKFADTMGVMRLKPFASCTAPFPRKSEHPFIYSEAMIQKAQVCAVNEQWARQYMDLTISYTDKKFIMSLSPQQIRQVLKPYAPFCLISLPAL